MKKLMIVMCFIVGAAAFITGCCSKQEENRWEIGQIQADKIMVKALDKSKGNYLALHQMRQLFEMLEEMEFQSCEEKQSLYQKKYSLIFYERGQEISKIIILDEHTVLYNDCPYESKQKIDTELLKRFSS